MNRIKIAKLIAVAVSLMGLFIVIGWIFDIGILKTPDPDTISIKFITAVCFILSGIMFYFIARDQEKENFYIEIITSTISFCILLFMATLFLSEIMGIKTGIEDLFVSDSADAVKSIVPGRPAIPAMLGFILISIAGIFSISNRLKYLTMFGSVVLVIGAVPIIGYLFVVPILTFEIAGIATPMAFYTALLFFISGIALILLSKK